MITKIDVLLIVICVACTIGVILSAVTACVYKLKQTKTEKKIDKDILEADVSIALTNLLMFLAPVIVLIIFKWILWGFPASLK